MKPARKNEVVVLRTPPKQPSKLVYIPENCLPNREGQGYVVKTGSHCKEVRRGDYVIYPRLGKKAGWSFNPKKDYVSEDPFQYDILEEDSIIAKVEVMI